MSNKLETILKEFIDLAEGKITQLEAAGVFFPHLSDKYTTIIKEYKNLIKDADKLLRKIKTNKTIDLK